ncbi:MAG: DUF2948 family protein [Rhodobacteraceae bacterium]|nr:DUF2948 family protein [Paracoccaceae bacterium]
MSDDARFEDADEGPIRLVAREADDLPVISALLQDAIFPVTEMVWDRRHRRFHILLNRFRWEDRAAAQTSGRAFERVRSLLTVSDVLAAGVQGFDRTDRDLVLSLLAIDFVPGADGTGDVILTLAGDGAIRLSVECLDLHLRDVTRPYAAPSGKAPAHDV